LTDAALLADALEATSAYVLKPAVDDVVEHELDELAQPVHT
jgi:hypothetical protein